MAHDYADRAGAKPADLPVQTPTKYELVVNLRRSASICRHRCSPARTK